jgi:hypothetical protein
MPCDSKTGDSGWHHVHVGALEMEISLGQAERRWGMVQSFPA